MQQLPPENVPSNMTITGGPPVAPAVEPPVVNSVATPMPSPSPKRNNTSQPVASNANAGESAPNIGANEEAKKTATNTPPNAPTCAPAEPPKKTTPCANPTFFYTQNKYWGGATLNFTIYRILAVVGGLFGLDHFYLRSPTTGFAKIILNLVTFGFWFFYDILQAFTERDAIEKYGISLPWYGPAGIGGGSFVTAENQKVENASPFWFMLYTIGLFVLPFGLDYLVAGDVPGAAFKAISSLMIFGLLYTVVNVYKLLTHPERVMCEGTTRYFPWTIVPGVSSYKPDAYFANTNRGACPDFKNTESSLSGVLLGIFKGLGNIPVVGTVFKVAEGVTSAVKTATEIPTQLQAGLQAANGVLNGAAQRAAAAKMPTEEELAKQNAQRAANPTLPQQMGGGGEEPSLIPGFTLALLFIAAIFYKGRESIAQLIERGQARPPAIGTILWRKENVGDVPPPAP